MNRISARYKVPIVITGFEPLDLLEGTLLALRQLESGRAEVENQYVRAVTREGNRAAKQLVFSVFEIGDRKWRGVGAIPESGYRLRPEFHDYDAERLFDVGEISTEEPAVCISGEILRGVKKPHDCPAFGTVCNPRASAGRDDGVGRGRLRRLLHVRTPPERASAMSEKPKADLLGASCPAPLTDHPQIVLGHGSGGKLTADLIAEDFSSRLQQSLSRAPRRPGGY